MIDRNLQALLAEAAGLRERGQVPEAIEAYCRLFAAHPELPDSWYNLGWLLRRAGRAEDALGAYGEALVRNVREPEEVQRNRAAIYSDQLYRPDDALAALREALRLNSRSVPALLNLGNLAEDLGDAGEARNAYERALQLSPGGSTALARLAGLGRARANDDAMDVRVRTALANPQVPTGRLGAAAVLARTPVRQLRSL